MDSMIGYFNFHLGSSACWTLHWLSVTSPPTHKQIGPFCCWFPGGWFCVHSRTLCISPTNSPVRLGISPATTILTGFYSQRFWGFIFPCVPTGTLCFMVCLTPQLFLPVYLHANVGLPSPPATALPHILSAPAACLHPCVGLCFRCASYQ